MSAALPRWVAGACPIPETALSYAQALAAPAAHSHRGNTAAAHWASPINRKRQIAENH